MRPCLYSYFIYNHIVVNANISEGVDVHVGGLNYDTDRVVMLKYCTSIVFILKYYP